MGISRDFFVRVGSLKAGFKRCSLLLGVHFASKCHQFPSFFAYPHKNAPDQGSPAFVCVVSRLSGASAVSFA